MGTYPYSQGRGTEVFTSPKIKKKVIIEIDTVKAAKTKSQRIRKFFVLDISTIPYNCTMFLSPGP